MYKKKESKVGLPRQDLNMDQNNKMDLFLHESPRVQEIILHQRLKDEIAKSGCNKLRYTDSELHFKSKQISASWAPGGQPLLISPRWSRRQLANSNSVQEKSQSSQRVQLGSERDLRRSNATPASAMNDTRTTNVRLRSSSNNNNNNNDKNNIVTDNQQEIHADESSGAMCQVSNCGGCLIRDMNQNLNDLSRMVQEQNEQLQRLKGRCLRSYFEKLNVSKNVSK